MVHHIPSVLDYHQMCFLLSQALQTVAWGDILTGSDYNLDHPEVIIAVQTFIPLSELHLDQNRWSWCKDIPDTGKWIRPLATSKPLIFIPFVNRPDLLQQVLTCLDRYREQIIIVDQSPDNKVADFWQGSLFHWQAERRLSRILNWIALVAWKHGSSHHFYAHNDIICEPDAIDKLEEFVHSIAVNSECGVTFTHYDTLACYANHLPYTVGCWDEQFLWYICDIDYYNRIQLAGFQNNTCTTVNIQHIGSQTLQALPPEQQQLVHKEMEFSKRHYLHKYGTSDLTSKPNYLIPYDLRL